MTKAKQLAEKLKQYINIEFVNVLAEAVEYLSQDESEIEQLKTQRNELLEALAEIEWSNNEQWRTERARIAIVKAHGISDEC